jgi:hypothetical protein
MTIAEARGKCKAALVRIPRDILVVSVVVLASSASFGLGFLAGTDAGQGSDDASLTSLTTGGPGQVLASKSGTKYYTQDCAAGARISETNKVWFVSAEAAEAAGYTRATNCGAN